MKSENGFFEFLKKKNGIWKAGAILLAGILLLSLGALSDGGGADGETDELSLYGAELEARVERLCSSLDGVGRAEAMITFASGELTVYEGSRAVGKKPPEVMSVTVLCEGAGNGEVVARLTEMLSSLLGIGTNRVKIMKISSKIAEYNGTAAHTI